LADRLKGVGETASSLAYTSLKLALRPSSCENVTRVSYVYNYYLFKDIVKELNNTLLNFPGSFTKELADRINSMYLKLSNLLTYTLLQSYSQTWNLKGKARLPSNTTKCISGIGPQTDWFPKACYVVEHPSSNGSIKYPCQRAMGALAYLLGDSKMIQVMCSLG